MIGAVFRDTFVYGLSSVLSKGIGLILLPLFARVLSPSEYGAFDLLMTLGVLVTLTVALEVAQGAGRLFTEVPEDNRSTLVSTAWWFSLAMYGLFSTTTIPLAAVIAKSVFHDPGLTTVVRLGVLAMSLNGLFYFLLNQLRWDMQSKKYAVLSISYALLLLFLTAFLTLALGTGLEGVLIAQCSATLFATVATTALLHTRIRWRFDREVLNRMLRFSAPLVPSGLATFVLLYANRLALSEFGSLADVGNYAVASRLAGASVLLIVGVQAALTPLIYLHYRDVETPGQIAQLFTWFCAVVLLVCLALGLFSRDVLSLLVTTNYDVSPVLVGLLAPALVLMQIYVFAPGITIAKKTNVQLLVCSIAAVVSLGLNIFLVPAYGGVGAAIATLAASAVMATLWFTYSQTYYPVPFHWRAITLASVAFALCSAAGYVVLMYLPYDTLSFLLRVVLLVGFGLGLLQTLVRPTKVRRAYGLLQTTKVRT